MICMDRCVSIGRATPLQRSCLISTISSGSTSARMHPAIPLHQYPSNRPRSLFRAGRGRRRYRARITTHHIRCSSTRRRRRLSMRTIQWRWHHPNTLDTRQWHLNTRRLHRNTRRWYRNTCKCKCRTILWRWRRSIIRCKCNTTTTRPRRSILIWRWHRSIRKSHHSSTRRWHRSILRCKWRTTR